MDFNHGVGEANCNELNKTNTFNRLHFGSLRAAHWYVRVDIDRSVQLLRLRWARISQSQRLITLCRDLDLCKWHNARSAAAPCKRQERVSPKECLGSPKRIHRFTSLKYGR